MKTQALFVRSLGALGCTWALEGVHCLAVGLVIKIRWDLKGKLRSARLRWR